MTQTKTKFLTITLLVPSVTWQACFPTEDGISWSPWSPRSSNVDASRGLATLDECYRLPECVNYPSPVAPVQKYNLRALDQGESSRRCNLSIINPHPSTTEASTELRIMEDVTSAQVCPLLFSARLTEGCDHRARHQAGLLTSAQMCPFWDMKSTVDDKK